MSTKKPRTLDQYDRRFRLVCLSITLIGLAIAFTGNQLDAAAKDGFWDFLVFWGVAIFSPGLAMLIESFRE